jgi:hypothetical protein
MVFAIETAAFVMKFSFSLAPFTNRFIPTAIVLALSAGFCFGQELKGIIDTHVHCDPDSAPRSIDALETARLARDEGMRALVFKNHYAPTVQLAYVVNKVVPGVEVYGAVVLNRAVGGINPEAVVQAATFKGGYAKVVWMPTFDAGNEADHPKRPFVPVSKDGKLLTEVLEVLRLMSKYKLALGTGHSSAAENLMLVRAARDTGVKGVVVTHPTGKMTVAQMKEAAADGAYIEFVYHSLLGPTQRGPKIEDYVREIRAIGPEHCILSSDLGQADSPVHTEGWKTYLEILRRQGITQAEIDLMARRNPARFLGLE